MSGLLPGWRFCIYACPPRGSVFGLRPKRVWFGLFPPLRLFVSRTSQCRSSRSHSVSLSRVRAPPEPGTLFATTLYDRHRNRNKYVMSPNGRLTICSLTCRLTDGSYIILFQHARWLAVLGALRRIIRHSAALLVSIGALVPDSAWAVGIRVGNWRNALFCEVEQLCSAWMPRALGWGDHLARRAARTQRLAAWNAR